MESTTHKSSKSALFEVYLRLRPATSAPAPERFLSVAEGEDQYPTHITLNPPNDNRRRAVEKFAFTRVFEEEANQLGVFHGTGVLPLVEGVLGPNGGDGRDGLLATLGVTGSGKSHTILGSRSQRGLTQLALDVLFRSIAPNILDPNTNPSLHATVAASDPSEAQVMSAQMFLDTMYGDLSGPSRASSRAPTPMVVRLPPSFVANNMDVYMYQSSRGLCPKLRPSSTSIRVVPPDPGPSNREFTIYEDENGKYGNSQVSSYLPTSYISSFMQPTFAKALKYVTKPTPQGESYTPVPTPRRNLLQRPSVLPQLPDISNVTVDADPNAEYAILISMYEVYNDRIFDLLTPGSMNKSTKDFRRRPLLFKPTEQSPDRKVVAGLRKIICGTMKEALMVLEAGLHERRVAGTGSNSVSSRSHGFFCVEVKKRRRSRMAGPWGGSALTIVDLAGSERARDAKTAGATLAEAGKINESLMYLGQCLQMQSDLGSTSKPNLVPFRQCKLTELLFSNSFPSSSHQAPTTTPSYHHYPPAPHRNPQKAIMIVTADPLGDFNATSQILRYSALAREITVPRIPSVTSTILAQSTASHYFAPRMGNGRSTPSDTERETMEIAALEIARMSEEIDGLRAELVSEQQLRLEVEAHLESLSDRALEIEQEVREEVYAEMEARMATEMTGWKARWAEESERSEEHVDRKLEIYTRSIDAVGIDSEDKENIYSGPSPSAKGVELEDENERLRHEVEQLRRELQGRSPTKSPSKRQPLRESRTTAVGEVVRGMETIRLSGDGLGFGAKPASPLKKVRKLTARKWDLMDEGDML